MNSSKLIHKCPRCGYETEYLCNMKSHLERKSPCKAKICDIPFDTLRHITLYPSAVADPTNSDQSTSRNKYVCKHCGKNYVHAQSLHKHMKTNHLAPKNCSDLVSRDEYEKLKTELDNLKNKGSSQPHQTISNSQKETEKNKELKIETIKLSKQDGLPITAHKSNVPLRLRETNNNFVYLLQEREFVKSNENVYKIGKSIQRNCRRIDEYPKFSEIILILEVDNCNLIENLIIREFNKSFEGTEYGNEYFKGDKLEMKKKMLEIVSAHYNGL